MARLLACGGRILAQGERINVKEWPTLGTLDLPYALVAVGTRQVLIVLVAEQANMQEQWQAGGK